MGYCLQTFQEFLGGFGCPEGAGVVLPVEGPHHEVLTVDYVFVSGRGGGGGGGTGERGEGGEIVGYINRYYKFHD